MSINPSIRTILALLCVVGCSPSTVDSGMDAGDASCLVDATPGTDGACTNSATVPASLTGGLAFTVMTGLGDVIAVSGGGGYEAVVLLTDVAVGNACATLGMGAVYAGSQSLFIGVISPAPIVTGEAYAIETSGGFAAQAETYVSDAMCHNASFSTAAGGSVTFTSLGGGTVAGHFNLTFTSGGTLAGSFAVPVCPSLGNAGSSGGGTTCLPP